MYYVYIVDYHHLHKTNGLNTYLFQLTERLKLFKGLKLHFIWIYSTQHEDFTKEIEGDRVHYYFPRHIALPGDKTDFDVKAVEYLTTEMVDQENIIVHFNWINHGPFAYLLKKKINCQTLLTKHCVPWRDLIAINYPVFSRINRIYEGGKRSLSMDHPVLLSEQLSYRAMDHIICVSHAVKQSLEGVLHYPSDQISVVYNGLDGSALPSVHRSRSALRKKYHIGLHEKVIIFAGSLIKRKGPYDLIRGFDQLMTEYPGNSWRLVVAGTGKFDALLKNIKTTWTKITFTGHLSKEQLYDFYALADIGVMPSYVEPFGYSALEMMAMGLPVIVADVDGLKEVVPEDCGFRVKRLLGEESAELDINDLKEKLLYFLENEEIAKEYGFQARAYALEHFPAERMASETIAVYEKILERKSHIPTETTIRENSPLVSIIVSCCDTENIDSILQQTWTAYEVIVINDGSNGSTESLFKTYEDERIRYIKNEKRCGVVDNLNRGVALAKGKYIIQINRDDVMHKTRLEKQVQYLEEYSDTALVGSWEYIMDLHDRIISLREYPAYIQEINLLMPFLNPFSHSSVMMRTDVVRAFRYNDAFRHCQDYELWIRIAEEHEVANIPEGLTYHRLRERNNYKDHRKEQKQALLELQSVALDAWGLDHSVEELAIHAVIGSRRTKQYFSSEEKQEKLRAWVHKVLTHQQKRHYCSTILREEIEDYILYDLCGIPLETVNNKEVVS